VPPAPRGKVSANITVADGGGKYIPLRATAVGEAVAAAKGHHTATALAKATERTVAKHAKVPNVSPELPTVPKGTLSSVQCAVFPYKHIELLSSVLIVTGREAEGKIVTLAESLAVHKLRDHRNSKDCMDWHYRLLYEGTPYRIRSDRLV